MNVGETPQSNRIENRRFVTRYFLGSVVLAGLALANCAANAEDRGSELPPVVVIGTPLPGAELDKDKVAAPIQTATAGEIDRSHAIDLTAFMNRTLGSIYVNDVQNNPLQADINFRGYTASPLLGTAQGLSVYLDGVRLNQPFGEVVSWDLIPRAAISSLTLMPGSNPLFGLNTLGGALSLRTKDGVANPGTELQVGYGSNERRSIEIESGGHADNGFNWYVTGSQLQDDGWRDASPTDATQAFGKLGWRNERTDLSLSAAYADTDLSGNGMQEQQFLVRDYASIYTKPDNTRNIAYLLNLVATHKVNDSIVLSGNAYYRSIDTDTLNGDINEASLGEALYQPTPAEQAALTAAGYVGFPTSGETQANTPFPSWRCIANILLNSEPNEKCNGLENRTATEQREGGVNLQVTFSQSLAGRANQLTFGAGYIRSQAHFTQSTRFGYLASDRAVVTVDGPGAFADGTQSSENAFDARVDLTADTKTYSVLFTDTLQVTKTIHLTVSGRYNETKIENLDGITPDRGPGSLTEDHEFSRFNPAVGITFAPNTAVSAYFGYSEGSRAPSAIELGCSDPNNPCRLPNALAGDPPLDQVITRTFETGLRGRVSAIVWNVGVFHAVNENDILFVTDDTSGIGFFKNFGETRRQGAEFGLNASFGKLSLSANYTYLEATYRSEEVVGGQGNSTNDGGPGFEGNITIEPGDRIPLTPQHIFKAGAHWQIVQQFSMSADVVYVGESFSRVNENNEHQADGLYYIGPGQTGGYTIANLGAEFRPSESLEVFAQVNNVLDHRYYSASQLGPTGFDAEGNFVARPFAGPIVNGERPLLNSTFYAPGAPRTYWLGIRYKM
jgi:outer membrane receptor protein involved in Fe transport